MKNMKKLLSAVGLLAVVAPVSLSVVACGPVKESEKKISEQDIVDAINKGEYSSEFAIKSTVENVNEVVTSDFIKVGLSKDIVKAFNSELFSFDKITLEEGTDLSNEDLNEPGLIEAEINYSYGNLVEQKTKFKINLTVTDQQIVDAINDVHYELNVTMNDSLESVIDRLLKTNFIENELDEVIKQNFNEEKFNFNKVVKEDGEEFTDQDFIEGEHNLKINYDYETIENQETNLLVNIAHGKDSLDNLFKDFLFVDHKDFKGFLDSADEAEITKQISEFLHLENGLETAGLSLDNKTNTSITLKASSESENYQGEVTLSWNLKLVELSGLGASSSNPHIKAGLKSYIYIDKDNSIKMFTLGIAYESYNPYQQDYHEIKIGDTDFKINGKPERIDNVTKRFNDLNLKLDDKPQISFKSPEISKIQWIENGELKSAADSDKLIITIEEDGLKSTPIKE